MRPTLHASVSRFAFALVLALLLLGPVAGGGVSAQVLIANDDEFGIPFAEPLIVEAFGVLDNDTLDGEAAGENGATAELVTDVGHGTLSLGADGSFTYSPDSTFAGSDTFVYQAVFGAATDEATVTLTACSGGAPYWTCWDETSFLAKATELGYATFSEGFEDDAVWGGVRTPATSPGVSSSGIFWEPNHPDPPASNEITTGSGAAHSGSWGLYDREHGYATGTPAECDVDDPPAHCLFHDGFTGTREPGTPRLRGVGGYVRGMWQANPAISLDGGPTMGGGKITPASQFFGVLDSSPLGFDQFRFVELDGKVGQALFIWADDITMAHEPPTSVTTEPESDESGVRFSGARPNPSPGGATFRFAIPRAARVTLAIHDVRGRLVRTLADGARAGGAHEVPWDGRNRHGEDVGSGIYFGRFVVDDGQSVEVRTSKIVVAR